MYLSDVLKAEETIQNLYYNGENPPHMYWTKFEQLLNNAYSVMRRKYSAECHPEEMKIRSLLKKIRDPALEHIHPVIIQRQEERSDYTYLHAMADIKKDVVRRHPNSDDNTKNSRRVKETTARKQQHYKHRGGRNSKPSSKSTSNDKTTHDSGNYHPDAKTITLTNGKKINYHPSFKFHPDTYRLFSYQQKKMLKDERRAFNQKKDQQSQKFESRIVKSIMSQLKDAGSIISAITQENNSPPGLPSSIMGGRNAQDKRNKGGRSK